MKNDSILITRRHALKTTALAAAACASVGPFLKAAAQGTVTGGAPPAGAAPTGPFTLPPLPYAFDALEPHIDARTMEIHHDKHHAAYVTNLNKALADAPELGKKSIEDFGQKPDRRAGKSSDGGSQPGRRPLQSYLVLADDEERRRGEPKGDLAQAIDRSFGSYSGFKRNLPKRPPNNSQRLGLARGRPSKVLTIEATPNQDNPISSSVSSLKRKLSSEVRPDPESGGPSWPGQSPGPGHRCLGTCVLSQVSKSPAGIHCRLVQRDKLGFC